MQGGLKSAQCGGLCLVSNFTFTQAEPQRICGIKAIDKTHFFFWLLSISYNRFSFLPSEAKLTHTVAGGVLPSLARMDTGAIMVRSIKHGYFCQTMVN